MLNVKLKENAIEERSDWRETSIRGALNSVLWRSEYEVRQTEQACTQHSMHIVCTQHVYPGVSTPRFLRNSQQIIHCSRKF